MNVIAAAAKSLQSCPTLRDPIDGSPPGFPVPGILQARTLEWFAIFFSIVFLMAFFFLLNFSHLFIFGYVGSLLLQQTGLLFIEVYRFDCSGFTCYRI